MSVHVLHDRPTEGQRFGRLALLVIGVLPNTPPLVAYEGRLQIVNAIGACTVRQIDGDALPPGTSLYVDPATQQVVVAWPEYQSGDLPVTDGSFEAAASDWDLGAGWVIGPDDGTTSEPQVRTGIKSARYNGSGESLAVGRTFYPCTPGTSIAFSAYVKQGASDANAVAADAGVLFFDASRTLIPPRINGNTVSDSDGPNFKPSQGTAVAPAGTAWAKPYVRGNRIRQNMPLWVDDYTWDRTGLGVGINVDRVIALTLQVDDSAGRSYIWRGAINVASQTVFPVILMGDQLLSVSTDGLIFGASYTQADLAAASNLEYTSTNRLVAPTGGSIRYSDDDFVISITVTPGAVSEPGLVPLINGTQVLVGKNSGGTLKSTDNALSFAEFNIAWSVIPVWINIGSTVFALTNTSTAWLSTDFGETATNTFGRLDSTAESFNPSAACAATDGLTVVYGGTRWGGALTPAISAFIPAVCATNDNTNFTFPRVGTTYNGANSSPVRRLAYGLVDGTTPTWVACLDNGDIWWADTPAGPWTQSATALLLNPVTARFNAGIFIFANATTVITSPDGKAPWTPVTTPIASSIRAIAVKK